MSNFEIWILFSVFVAPILQIYLELISIQICQAINNPISSLNTICMIKVLHCHSRDINNVEIIFLDVIIYIVFTEIVLKSSWHYEVARICRLPTVHIPQSPESSLEMSNSSFNCLTNWWKISVELPPLQI